MAEQGKITISVGVDSGDAIDGLKDLQDGLKDMGDASGKAGKKVTDSFSDVDKAAKKAGKGVAKGAGQAGDALEQLADDVEETEQAFKGLGDLLNVPLQPKIGDFPQIELPEQFELPPIEIPPIEDEAPIKDTIVGLEDLKDRTGELDSSLKGLGGAVGLVSPELERLLFVTGELSGGVEAASRLNILAGGSMRTLMMAGGALGVGLAALGGTFAIMSRQVKQAEQRLLEAHQEMEAGIAFAKQYKDQLQGLQNSVGLLSDEEFALIDARRRSNEFMKEEIEGQRAQRHVVNALQEEIARLEEQHAKFQGMIGQSNLAGHDFEMQQYDVAEALRLTQEQIEAGEPILSENGRSIDFVSGLMVTQGEAAQMVRDNIDNLKGSLSIYQQEIDGTERKTERLNILMQIQAAQARDDRQAVAELAMSLAVLDDTETRLFKATIEAAKAFAIQNAQMANLGAGTAVAIASIERLFSKYEQTAAPQAFQQTLASLNTKLEDNAEATDKATASLEKSLDVQAEIEKQMSAEADLRDAARAAVALELSDRDAIKESYKKQKAELDNFLGAGAIEYEEYVEKIGELEAKKNADLLTHDVGVAQARLATAEAFNSQFEALIDSRSERRLQKLAQEEANALALASGSEEAQAAIRAEFEAKRKEELNAAFKASQKTQIATAIMSGANAAIGALAPPPVGLGPNAAGIAMAGLVATTTAAQVGVIANQKPSFHQGGMIPGQGDQMITAQGGEAVLNRAAVASLGGESGVDSLNAGGAAGGAVVVQMVYKQRVLDELIVDNLAKGGPLKRAINDSSRRARRGRIGGRL